MRRDSQLDPRGDKVAFDALLVVAKTLESHFSTQKLDPKASVHPLQWWVLSFAEVGPQAGRA